ncbi:MAG: hypothetical protein NTW84_04010 [Methanothrix sp.]|nr:hypothetical protein [Methanothrix sp.]
MKEDHCYRSAILTLLFLAMCISLGLGQEASDNNLPGGATQIQVGQAVQDSISKAGEIDYFVLPLDTSGIISISLDAVPEDMRPRIIVTNEYTSLWADSAAVADKTATNAGDTIALEKDVRGPSGYWISISDANGKAHNTAYSMTMNFRPAPDENEPNNLLGEATIVQPDQELKAYICPAGDVDYYRMDVNTSGILVLKVKDVPENFRPRVFISNEYSGLWADSAAMADKTATNGGDSLTLEKALFGPSSYWIAVTDADGKAQSDPHTLTFAFEPAPDSNEPNEEIGDATEVRLDQVLTAYICPGNDKDFYKLYMSSPGVVAIQVEGVPEDMRPYLLIRDKNNRQIADKAATNPGDSLTLEKDLGAGWNYIAVSDADGKAHSKPYELTVTAKIETQGGKGL